MATAGVVPVSTVVPAFLVVIVDGYVFAVAVFVSLVTGIVTAVPAATDSGDVTV